MKQTYLDPNLLYVLSFTLTCFVIAHIIHNSLYQEYALCSFVLLELSSFFIQMFFFSLVCFHNGNNIFTYMGYNVLLKLWISPSYLSTSSLER